MKTEDSLGDRVTQSGSDYGQDLAAAFVLATSRGAADQELTRHLTRIVLREISATVQTLRDAQLSVSAIDAYEHACLAACREELLRSARIPLSKNSEAA